MNAERAARRARPKRMRLSKIIKELNKENAPPDGWRPEDKVSSSQAGGPAPKGSGFKRIVYDVDTLKVLGYYKTHK